MQTMCPASTIRSLRIQTSHLPEQILPTGGTDMRIMTDAAARAYIPITGDMVPCSIEIKLTDKTYRMAFKYNEAGDFFTVDLSIPVPDNDVLCYGEIVRYGKPLFEQFSDERYPLPLIVPAAADGDQIDTITYDNFGQAVKLWLVDRGD